MVFAFKTPSISRNSLAAGRIKNGAAPLNHVGDAAHIHFNHVAIDQAVVAPHDAQNFHIFLNCRHERPHELLRSCQERRRPLVNIADGLYVHGKPSNNPFGIFMHFYPNSILTFF